MGKEDKSFQKFVAICYLFGFISLLSLGIVWAYGIPNFSDIDEQRIFCKEYGGMPIEPSRQNYNEMLCLFSYENNTRWMTTIANEITNEDWAKHFGKEVGDYCFSCWNRQDCSSPYNDVLREKGVHC